MPEPLPDSEDQLDQAILLAHANNDAGRLTELYLQAADVKAGLGEKDAEGFLLVQAYVFALDSNHAISSEIHKRLVIMGRES